MFKKSCSRAEPPRKIVVSRRHRLRFFKIALPREKPSKSSIAIIKLCSRADIQTYLTMCRFNMFKNRALVRSTLKESSSYDVVIIRLELFLWDLVAELAALRFFKIAFPRKTSSKSSSMMIIKVALLCEAFGLF